MLSIKPNASCCYSEHVLMFHHVVFVMRLSHPHFLLADSFSWTHCNLSGSECMCLSWICCLYDACGSSTCVRISPWYYRLMVSIPCLLLQLVIVATTRIKKMHEIIVDYGEEYWSIAARIILADHKRYHLHAKFQCACLSKVMLWAFRTVLCLLRVVSAAFTRFPIVMWWTFIFSGAEG